MLNLKWKTHHDGVQNKGSWSHGSVKVDYSTLVKLFGKPLNCDSGKVDWEWHIEFEDGRFIAIHNWKDGPNYCGESIKPYEIEEWTVASNNNAKNFATSSEDLINHIINNADNFIEAKQVEDTLKEVKDLLDSLDEDCLIALNIQDLIETSFKALEKRGCGDPRGKLIELVVQIAS